MFTPFSSQSLRSNSAFRVCSLLSLSSSRAGSGRMKIRQKSEVWGKTPKRSKIAFFLLIIFFPIIILLNYCYPDFPYNSSSLLQQTTNYSFESNKENWCDLFSGEWVPNPEAPYYYRNETCWAIQEHQNCIKYGRPDRDYLKWRWKPDDDRCADLPIFDPNLFFQLVRGKSLAFVGDSLARNHMQSLICLLSKITYPEDVSAVANSENKRYLYRDQNFTISMLWSPYLVKSEITDFSRPFKLYLDEFDENWTTKIVNHDYVIISAGHWFMRPTYFHEKGKLVGCLFCPSSDNLTALTSDYSYQRAFRTAFKAINSIREEDFKGVIYLRTFAPSHFEGGAWNGGGKCARTKPFKRNETSLADYAQKMYQIQLDELQIAEREGRRKGRKFRLFDATKSLLLRPDGHPGRYGHWPQQKVVLAEDCVHWCLPGPIDSLNDILFQLFKREQQGIHT